MRDGDFRVRGKEISRVEGLSDAVFGFAITLLIVSLEVPKSADEVLHAMRGFFAFTITFTILFSVWRTQFSFFRRYGLEDRTTVNLTAVLLFVVLFFVYPLKFVIGAIVERLLKHAGFPDPNAVNLFKEPHAGLLMMTYGLGLAAVFGVFTLLYRHAYTKRDELQLTDLETFDTRQAMMACLGSVIFGTVLAAMNLISYLLPEGRTDEWVSSAMAVCIIAIAGLFVRARRRAGVHRKALMASLRTVVES